MELQIIKALNEDKVSDAEQIYHKLRCAYNSVYFEFFAKAHDIFDSNCPDFDSLIDKPFDFLLNSMTEIADALLQVLFEYDIYSMDVNVIIDHVLNDKSTIDFLSEFVTPIDQAVANVQKIKEIYQPSGSNRANVHWDFANWFEEGYDSDGINGAKSNISSNLIKSLGLSAINAAIESKDNTKLRKAVNDAKKRAYNEFFDDIKKSTFCAIANLSKCILCHVYITICIKFGCQKDCTSIANKYSKINHNAGRYFIEKPANITIYKNVNDMYAQGKLSVEKAVEQIGKIIIENPYSNPIYYTRLMQLCPENADDILATAEIFGMNAFTCCNSMFLLMLEPSNKDTAATFDVNIKLLKKAMHLTDMSEYKQIMNKLINQNQTAKEYCLFCGVNSLEQTTAHSSELNDIESFLEKAKNRMSEKKAQDKLSLCISDNFTDIDFNNFSKKNSEKIRQAKQKLEKFSNVESKEKQELFRKIKKYDSDYKQYHMSEFIDKNLAGVDFSVYSEENYEKIFNAYEKLESENFDVNPDVKKELLQKIEKYYTEYDKYQFENNYFSDVIEKINFHDYTVSNYEKIKAENDAILNKYKNVESEKKNEALTLFDDYFKRFEQNRLVVLKKEYEEFVKKNLSDDAFVERTEYQKKYVSDKLEIIKTDYAEVVSEDLIKRCDEYIKNAKTTSAIIGAVIGYIIGIVIIILIVDGLGKLLSKIPIIGKILGALAFGLKVICFIGGIAIIWDELANIKKKY